MTSNKKKAIIQTTIIDLRLQIGDTVSLFILKGGRLTMVKGKVSALDYEKKIASISYEEEHYSRPFKQVERFW